MIEILNNNNGEKDMIGYVEKQFKLSDEYFEHGMPSIKGNYIEHKPGGEKGYELEAAFGKDDSAVIGTCLTSAWTWGFDNISKYCAQRSQVIGYDLIERTVTINVWRLA